MGCCGNAGAGVAGAGCVVVGLRLGSATEVRPPINTGEAMLRMAISAASTQVPFSRTSVVCLTPMNWLLNPAMLPERPPPFGFCTSMKNEMMIDVRMISTRKNIAMSHYFNWSILAAK